MARYTERHELDGYQSSREIMEAIEQIALDEFTGDDDTNAHQIWASPTAEQTAQVLAIAWSMADADEDRLHWGCETFKRPAQ